MGTEQINLELLESAVADINDGKVCIEPSADSDLGFIMMGYKDYASNTQKLLAKNNPAYISTLRITALAGTSGFVTHDASGDISGSTITGTELNSFISDENVIFETAFDAANTIIKADTLDTPVSLTVPVSTLVGRKSTGYIDALTASEAKDLLLTTLSDVMANGSSSTLSDGIPFALNDIDSNPVISVYSDDDGGGNAENAVMLGNAATVDITVQGDALTLIDATYTKTLTQIVEDIAAEQDKNITLLAQTETVGAATDTAILAVTSGGVDYPTLAEGYSKTMTFVIDAIEPSGSEVKTMQSSWDGQIQLRNPSTGSGSSVINSMTLKPVYSKSSTGITLDITDISLVAGEIQITVEQVSTDVGTRTINWEMVISNIITKVADWES